MAYGEHKTHQRHAQKDSKTYCSFQKTYPICTSTAESGCVIHYRSYSDGTIFDNSPSAYGSTIDSVLAEQGFLNRPFNPDTDIIACVNPSLTPLPDGHLAKDKFGNDVASGDIRILGGTYLYGLFAGLYSGVQTDPVAKHIPGRYTATCRRNESSEFLAIGLHEVSGTTDVRGDPLNIRSADALIGLHLYDFTLTLGELIEQLKIKAASMK